MKSTLEIVSDGLAARNVPILLIGGMALHAFDVVRQTVDVDCLLADDDADILRAVLTEAGYEEQEHTENFSRYVSPLVHLMDIDVLLVDKHTFTKMLERSRPVEVGHTVIHVPCAAHLIALKLHAMKNDPKRETKDLSDIIEILRNNPGAVPDDELQAIGVRHGPSGIYARLKGSL
ncbi:MAG: hypothetical protein A2498_09645 [Lentisphaerae bacterium RIFOXYC12_FULL_60_16]|nr:MAG: hypothetical protein A2498_09645 [Lentisphaerae bacterium RIFOXYC12_FULL_60_16]OGV78483.1 MAG: hypothetical protein A2340_07505 [Lentisphaerae bacterium RIFOXYB12_FULL_60_10]